MNVTSLITKDYRKKDDFAVRKNKPNTNPNKVCPERSRMGQFQTQGFLAKTMRFATLERQLCNGAPGSLLANQA